jgi:ABC-type sugar transport system substrate-binding protein
MKKTRIVVVPFATYDPFFQQVRAGVDAARTALADRGVEVEWLDIRDVSVDNQVETIASLVAQGVSGIALCPIDQGKVQLPIRHCFKRGIPVATFCLDAPNSDRFFHIGQNLWQSGRLAGYIIGKFVHGKGNVGIITGFFSMEGHESRRKGFIEIIEEEFPSVTILWQEENHDHWEEAYEIVNNHVQEGTSPSALYITAGGPFGAANAMEDLGESENMTLVCFDLVPETVEYIRKGVIDASIGQNPFRQGYRSVMAVYEYLQGKKPDAEIEYVNLDIAMKENIESYSFPI